MHKITVLISGIAILISSCGGGSDSPTSTTPDQEPTTGAIEISTETTGKDKDDGYLITVDGTNNTSVDSSDIIYVTDLGEGSYEIQLKLFCRSR